MNFQRVSDNPKRSNNFLKLDQHFEEIDLDTSEKCMKFDNELFF